MNPGAVLATKFAALGAKLILSARNKEELERVKNEIISKFRYRVIMSVHASTSSSWLVLCTTVQYDGLLHDS